VKRIILIAVACLVFLTSVVALYHRKLPAEPSYRDKTLSAWLNQLDYSHRPQDVQASNAVYQMSTNILPFLRPPLRAHDSRLKLAAFRLLSKQRMVRFTFTPAEAQRQRASRACRVLGPSAAQFLPELTAMLDSPDRVTAWCGFVAIADVKPGAQRIPELTKALTNGYGQVRSSAASHLGNLGEQAKPAVPALIKSLNDGDAEVRVRVINALVRIHPDTAILLPVLISSLDDKSPVVRQEAGIALGRLGNDAEPAKAKLVKCLEDEDERVRDIARNALRMLVKEPR